MSVVFNFQLSRAYDKGFSYMLFLLVLEFDGKAKHYRQYERRKSYFKLENSHSKLMDITILYRDRLVFDKQLLKFWFVIIADYKQSSFMKMISSIVEVLTL